MIFTHQGKQIDSHVSLACVTPKFMSYEKSGTLILCCHRHENCLEAANASRHVNTSFCPIFRHKSIGKWQLNLSAKTVTVLSTKLRDVCSLSLLRMKVNVELLCWGEKTTNSCTALKCGCLRFCRQCVELYSPMNFVILSRVSFKTEQVSCLTYSWVLRNGAASEHHRTSSCWKVYTRKSRLAQQPCTWARRFPNKDEFFALRTSNNVK